MEAIHGVTIEVMAETMSKHNELRAQHGEPGFKSHFHGYLLTRGIDENTWANAWNGWHARMDADKTGGLWGKYHAIESELSRKAHFGDVEDMSQQERGGLTLDMFAKLSAQIAQPGADFAAVLAQHGVGVDLWNTGRTAWNDAMAQDTLHKITTQFGALYAKHNPAHAAMMQAHIGQAMANRGASSSQEDEEEEEYTAEKALGELASKVPATRWKAAHLLAQKIQTELASDPPRKRAAMACVPVLIEALERHDKETVSSAESAARDLVELEQFTDDAKGAIARCLARGQDHLANVQAAFAPIKDKNVPERVYLQSEIQDYTSLTETLTEILGEWDEKAGEARNSAGNATSARGTDHGTPANDDGGAADMDVGGLRGLWNKLRSLFS
jgi:hypothetical protein